MKPMLFISVIISSFIVFFVATNQSNIFGMDGEKVEIPMIFTDKNWEPENMGTGKNPEEEPDKWVKVSEGPEPPAGMEVGEVIYKGEITVYKLNPCTVCGPSGCYVKQNC